MPRSGYSFFVATILLGLGGCSKPTHVTFTRWVSTKSQAMGSNEASDKLVAAGMAVDQQAKLSAKRDSKGRLNAPITTRTNFFPKQKAEARKVIGGAAKEALLAAKSITSLNYMPTGIGQAPAYLSGLRLIGTSLIWDIEAALLDHNYDKAIVACGSATRLGYALMSGGVYEVSLGSSFINQARHKMVPILNSLSGNQLGNLGSAIQKSASLRPPIYLAVENEKENMLLGLQQAQDLFESGKLDQLDQQIGVSGKDAVDMLRSMSKSPENAKTLFDWIGNDIKSRSDWYLTLLKNPQTPGLAPKKEEKKANLMLYRYFGSSIENLVPMLQATYCRTQLFVLECYLKQKMKLQKPIPSSLSAFSKPATIDPFTGEPFYYKSGGMTYVLYSAGEDGIDNGGKTDSSFRRPDFLLEKPHI